MKRSIFNHNTRPPHPVYGRAIQALRQKAQMMLEQSKRTARFTSQAAALNCAAAFLADCRVSPPEQPPDKNSAPAF
jgi:hypothetical protein